MKKAVEDGQDEENACKHMVQYQVKEKGIIWQICKHCKRALEVRKANDDGN
jgi:hypothetical protein